jgi:hypothetical protein
MKPILSVAVAALLAALATAASAQSAGSAAQPSAAPATAHAPATPAAAAPPAATPPTAAPATASVGNGTLTVDVKPFTSEIPLDKKVEDQLRGAGVEWGLKDGKLVQTMVNKQFVNFDISILTRYGQQKSMDVPSGDYTITCVGMIPHTGFSVQSILAKSAYVNQDVLRFHVDAGKTTTLIIQPVMKKDATLFATYFVPDLMTSITTDAGTTAPVSINARTPQSIAWPAYNGPLKF